MDRCDIAVGVETAELLRLCSATFRSEARSQDLDGFARASLLCLIFGLAVGSLAAMKQLVGLLGLVAAAFIAMATLAAPRASAMGSIYAPPPPPPPHLRACPQGMCPAPRAP